MRCAMSVKILSTVETSCVTKPQQIAVVELEGYSWSTCSKQHDSCLMKLLPYIIFEKYINILASEIKWPAQGTGTVLIVPAHFRSL